MVDDGKFDEARTALEKVIRDYPDAPGSQSAQFRLSKLEQIEAGQAKAREMQKQREKTMEGMTARPQKEYAGS